MDQFTVGRIGITFGTIHVVGMAIIIVAEVLASVLLVTQGNPSYLPLIVVMVLFTTLYTPAYLKS